MSDYDIDDIKRRMEGSVSSLKNEFMGLRAGRASTAMLEPIMVDAYGSKMPMNQVGNISAPESRLLTVTVWDASMTAAVEKAIRESDLGLNPMTEGNLIRVPIPDLSEDRRKEMVKVAGRYAEAARVAVRNIRRDGMDQIKKAKSDGMSEDDQKFWEESVQEITDKAIKDIDAALDIKQSEIMQV